MYNDITIEIKIRLVRLGCQWQFVVSFVHALHTPHTEGYFDSSCCAPYLHALTAVVWHNLMSEFLPPTFLPVSSLQHVRGATLHTSRGPTGKRSVVPLSSVADSFSPGQESGRPGFGAVWSLASADSELWREIAVDRNPALEEPGEVTCSDLQRRVSGEDMSTVVWMA